MSVRTVSAVLAALLLVVPPLTAEGPPGQNPGEGAPPVPETGPPAPETAPPVDEAPPEDARPEAAAPGADAPAWDGAKPADADAPLPQITFRLSGFISASAFAQDQSFGFGNGQRTEWAANQRADADTWFAGGDVRNTRLRLTTQTDPRDGGMVARGVLEMDFFGSFNGGGAFNDEQPQPRMRLAYVELEKGGTLLRVGQGFTPLWGMVPVSVTHIAYPLGLGSAGMVGWRYPGILFRQRLTGGGGGLQVDVQGGAFRGSWEEAELHDPSEILEHLSAGEAGIPQLEARIDLSAGGSVSWQAFIVGHWDRKDLSGVGHIEIDDELTGTAVAVGGRVDAGPWTVQGNGYLGRAIGQQFGALTQFGDIGSRGGWLQLGYHLTDKASVWAFRGVADPEDADVRASGNSRLRNDNLALSAQYDLGTYRAGVEWLCSDTRWVDEASMVARTAHQFSFSLLYAF